MSAKWSSAYQILRFSVRELRENAGLTQTQAASALGKPQSYMSKIESGERKLDVLELRALCRVYGINWVDFVQKLEALLMIVSEMGDEADAP